MELKKAIETRRSHREFTGKVLSSSFVHTLLETATKAPNHKRNQPWRFVVVAGEEIPALLDRLLPAARAGLGSSPGPEQVAKIDKLERSVRKLGAVVYVTSLRDADTTRDWENYAAVVCAVQNLMLLGVEAGLGSFWSTGKVFAAKATADILGVDLEKERFVGAIWLGETTDHPAPPIFDLDGRVRDWRP